MSHFAHRISESEYLRSSGGTDSRSRLESFLSGGSGGGGDALALDSDFGASSTVDEFGDSRPSMLKPRQHMLELDNEEVGRERRRRFGGVPSSEDGECPLSLSSNNHEAGSCDTAAQSSWFESILQAFLFGVLFRNIHIAAACDEQIWSILILAKRVSNFYCFTFMDPESRLLSVCPSVCWLGHSEKS